MEVGGVGRGTRVGHVIVLAGIAAFMAGCLTAYARFFMEQRSLFHVEVRGLGVSMLGRLGGVIFLMPGVGVDVAASALHGVIALDRMVARLETEPHLASWPSAGTT